MRFPAKLSYKSLFTICICFVLLLSACGQEQSEVLDVSSASPAAAVSSEPEKVSSEPPVQSEASSASPMRADRSELSMMMVDPPYDFDPKEMLPGDFGEFFTEHYDVARSEQKIMEGTPYETTMTVIESAQPGPTVFVVAGVHGDEAAAWNAGYLLQKAEIKTGKLYVIAPGNALGAKNLTRYVVDKLDLNRSFPGNPNGNPAEQIADAILSQIKEAQPVMLLDLHEARNSSLSRDYLGSSLIYTELDGMEDFFFDMMIATQMGDICSEPFAIHSPGPVGSINRTVTCELSIPSITVETFRGYPMERRISDQLDIVQYALRYYGMI